MAQKASPYAIRLGYNQTWNNYIFPENKAKQIEWIKKDKKIRSFFKELFPEISKLKIEYTKHDIFFFVHIPNINLALGENNKKMDLIMKNLYQIIEDKKINLKVNLIEVKKIYTNAQAIADTIASQLKKRVHFRLVLRNLLSKVITERENKGIKIKVKGLIDNSDIAQTKKSLWGKMPLSSIDSNIEVGKSEAVTSRGKIGIEILLNLGKKIW